MKLHEFVNDIFDIAMENNVDVGVGLDMFLENVRSGVGKYKGSKVNFHNFKPYYPELMKSRQDYEDSIHDHYQDVCILRANGRREQAKNLVYRG